LNPVNSITADGEGAFLSNDVLNLCEQFGIKTYFYKADYLNHIRMVESAIKTLRNIFNVDTNRMMINSEMQKGLKISTIQSIEVHH
jgi:hypothetical protein